MMDGWRTGVWGELATLEYGKSLRGYRATSEGFRVYGTNGPIGWHSDPLCVYPSVVIGRKGAYRGVHYSGEPFFVIDTAFYLKPKVAMDTRWAYYQLRTQNINGLDSGSAIPSTSREDFYSLPVEVPPLDEQRAIARVLGALDDKIELNRRMSATLEAMARALFKSWFVDFEPVRAKVEGRPSGLPPALDALFPASFEASELGEIPSGWGVRSLDGVAETVRGRSYRSAELAESDTALVTLKSFARGGGYRPDGLKPYTGTYKPAQVVGPGELVIACTDVTQAAEVIGRPAIVPADPRFTALVASLDTLIIRPRDVAAAPVPFLYCLTSEPSFTQHTYAHVSGTTVLHLSKEAVPAFKFALPPSDVMRAFIGLAEPAFKRMTDLSGESAATAAQRDALLPRLVSGEVLVGSYT